MREMREVLNELMGEDLTAALVLRGARIRANLSQDELAEVSGIQRSNISALENGRIEMTLKYAGIFGAALNIHPAELLFPNGNVRKTTEMKAVEKRLKALNKKRA
ncbi:helix-turn-helix transcriptional regulator [Bdellovibrio sp. HCB209]|uniref:helix-turn-helix transcriptional regulator n=1 Tax=Bdellovibrio sp. HCB209 TaxID=3394354 RepID=UPI0039B4DBF8